MTGRVRLVACAIVLLVGASSRAKGQESAHDMGGMTASPEHAAHMASGSSAEDILELEQHRNASGTAWQPATTPHAAFHARAGALDLMVHGLMFGAVETQSSERGTSTAFGVGWLMGMATYHLPTSALTARLMLSPEPWIAGYHQGGYPLLLQTGETYQGQPLHDRQHPHDLFMEAALLYTQALSQAVALQIYAAPAGEPALGPVAFPHRFSASAIPLATISHHWQDATHISFGVLTVGVLTRFAKLEGSWFNGREPDETRYDFDLRRPDSYAFRLSVAPAPGWSGQASYGYLREPESLRPGVSVQRFTASVMRDGPLASHGHWASSAIVGANKESGDALSPSFLVETNLDLDGFNVLFGRAEVVEKSGRDLVLAPDFDESHLWLGALTLGYLRNFGPVAGLLPGLGILGQLDEVPSRAEPFYGSRWPLTGLVYLRLTVAPMTPS